MITSNAQFRIRRVKIPNHYHKRYTNCCLSSSMKERLDNLGSSYLIWFLKKDQIEYIKNNYQYSVTPIIYKVNVSHHILKTRARAKTSIIKELQKCSYKNRAYLVTHLKKKDIDVLDSYGIQYTPFKYIIQK